MIVCRNADDLRRHRSALTRRGRVAFFPTMGALHNGHLALVKLAAQRAASVVASIFVNPTQFAPHEDFGAYPRRLESDLAALEAADVAIAYVPSIDEIYPNGPETTVRAGPAADGLESLHRPHFFDGVCTVVRRLFAHAEPDLAVFGEKDYQQLMVIREMVEAEGLAIEIIGGPTVRDAHGLALSSRNAYLSAEELEIARRLNAELRSETPSADRLIAAGFDKVDYVEERWGRVLAAAWIGDTRLIDNVAANTVEPAI